jgi:hypothetical protein
MRDYVSIESLEVLMNHFRSVLVVFSLLFLQLNLFGLSLIIPAGFFLYCMFVLMFINLLTVMILTLPYKLFSPTFYCILWILVVSKQVFPELSVIFLFNIGILTTLLIFMVLLNIDVFILRRRSKKLLSEGQ